MRKGMHSLSVWEVEDETRGFEFIAEFQEVLNDAVVDDGDLSVGVGEGMRVLVGGLAVGSPTSVADADYSAGGRLFDGLPQF